MNRVIGEVPAKRMIIFLVGVGVLVLAVLAAQYVLTVGSPLGPEVETVLVEDPAPAEASAPVAESATVINPSSPEFDVRLADNYRISTEANEGFVTVINPSSPDFDVRLADNYRIFTHAVDAAGPEFDVREADNYRIFTQE